MISPLVAFALPLAYQVLAAPLPASATAQGLDISQGLQNILSNSHNSPAYTYPTDLTRGIVVKPIHSHNDYWRDVPFFSALSVGAGSIEADVWLFNNTLFVGHETSALTATRTLASLYIQPILDVLHAQNPDSPFVTSPTRNGVYDTAADQTIALFIDVKTDGAETWPVVVEALEPLRAAGYLTTFNGTGVTFGPVTVVGTGNTPLDQILPVRQRDFFFDAHLDLLNSTETNLTAAVAPIASASFADTIGAINGTTFSDAQLELLQSQIGEAKRRGMLARYFETPAWPISTRNAVWSTLVSEGVGLLSVDDLPAAAGFGGVSGVW